MIKLARHRESADLVAVGGKEPRTASQLQGLVNALAAVLGGPPAGSRVVLACEDRYYFAAALLALWKRGLVASLPSNGQPETVRALARAPESAGLLRDRDDDIGLDVRAIEARAREAEPVFEVAVPPHTPAVVAYTSGSTGEPVGHEKTLAQLIDEPLALIEAFGLAHKGVLASVPPYHLYGLLFGVLVPLLGGGRFSRTSPHQPLEVLLDLGNVLAGNAHAVLGLLQHGGVVAGQQELRTNAIYLGQMFPFADQALLDHGIMQDHVDRPVEIAQ